MINLKDILSEAMFPKDFDRHSLGSCMSAAALATDFLLSKGIVDFTIIEGWVSLYPDQEKDEWSPHTWIKFKNGKVFDPTKKQWKHWGFDPKDVQYTNKIRKKYTPQEYQKVCQRQPDDISKFKKTLNETHALDGAVSAFESSLLSKYPQIDELGIYIQTSDNALYISDLYIKPEFRGQGIGGKIMKDITDFADKNKLTIVLIPEPEELNKNAVKRLIDFYKRFGFVLNKGKYKNYSLSGSFATTMYRYPKSKLNESAYSDYNVAVDFFERRESEMFKLSVALKQSKGHGRLHWTTISSTLLKKVWLMFGKYHKINENDIDKIADQILTNIARLSASTAMMGHSSENVRPDLADNDYVFTDEEWDVWMPEFFTDINGAWLISDFGLPKLEKLYYDIFNANTPEDKLYACDKALNIIHQRSDLAAMFVEGGTVTLNYIANQGGYTSDINENVEDGEVLNSISEINDNVKQSIAKSTQLVYNEWIQDDEGNDEELGAGGICDGIADGVINTLQTHNIHNCQTIYSEPHTYVIGKFKEGVFTIDIPYNIYERGNLYTWTKIPNVIFTKNDIIIDELDNNPSKFDQYIDD
jgi:GNAT superfamily N-acetyltransferase